MVAVPRPPLRLAFAVQYGHTVSRVPVAHGGRVFVGTPEGVRAFDVKTGERLWQSEASGFPLGAQEETVFVRRLSSDRRLLFILALEAGSGRLGGTVLETPSMTREVVHGGTLVYATSHGGEAVCAVDLPAGSLRWRWPVDDSRGVWGNLAADGDTVYVTLRDGPVIALDLERGQPRWRQTLDDLVWSDLGEPRRGEARPYAAAAILGDRVVLEAEGGWVAALTRGAGGRAWAYRAPGPILCTAVQAGAYHALSVTGDLVTLDPVDGRVVSSANINRKVPRPAVPITRPTRPMLVSDTHVYTGSDEGFVLAFERPKNKYVWSYRPKGAGTTDHFDSRFVVAGRRLYYSDMSRRLFCLEEADS